MFGFGLRYRENRGAEFFIRRDLKRYALCWVGSRKDVTDISHVRVKIV